MKTHAFAIGLVLAALSGCSMSQHSTQKAAKQDSSEIQGTWKLVALEADGKPMPAEIVAALRLVFKGDTLVFTPGEPGFTNYKYQLDPAKRPGMFAMTHEDGSEQGKTQNGIYLLNGDHLKICLGRAGQVPDDFTTAAGSGQAMYSLIRER